MSSVQIWLFQMFLASPLKLQTTVQMLHPIRIVPTNYIFLVFKKCYLNKNITVSNHNILTSALSPRSTQPSIPQGEVNRVPASMAVVKAGCAHLCRVAGNTVASDTP